MGGVMGVAGGVIFGGVLVEGSGGVFGVVG